MTKKQIGNVLYCYAGCDFKFRQALCEFERSGELNGLIDELAEYNFKTPYSVIAAIRDIDLIKTSKIARA